MFCDACRRGVEYHRGGALDPVNSPEDMMALTKAHRRPTLLERFLHFLVGEEPEKKLSKKQKKPKRRSSSSASLSSPSKRRRHKEQSSKRWGVVTPPSSPDSSSCAYESEHHRRMMSQSSRGRSRVRRQQQLQQQQQQQLLPQHYNQYDGQRRQHPYQHQQQGYPQNAHPQQQAVWRTAMDPATGRVYYYDAVSRRTQWEKPVELEEMERRAAREMQRKKDEQFFAEMERNIYKSLTQGLLHAGNVTTTATSPSSNNSNTVHMLQHHHEQEESRETLESEASRAVTANPTMGGGPPKRENRVRTISGMDENLFAELTEADVKQMEQQAAAAAAAARATLQQQQQQQAGSAGRRPPRPRRSRTPVGRRSSSKQYGLPPAGAQQQGTGQSSHPIQQQKQPKQSAKEPSSSAATPQKHIRRNTGGTIYVESTMTKPNVDKTIKCVCGVYRAHVVEAAKRCAKLSPSSVYQYDENLEIFMDSKIGQGRRLRHAHSSVATTSDSSLPPASSSTSHHRRRNSREMIANNIDAVEVPSLDEIVDFYEHFYQRSQMEHDTIIMSLIYVERLVKETNGYICPHPQNWKSILFSCMVLASKVWDDLSMWNVDFSRICVDGKQQKAYASFASFTLERINQLELALLKSLNFNVRVPASEYAKYYFLIRTMLMKSGLVWDDPSNEALKPLDMTEANNLETLSGMYQEMIAEDVGGKRVMRRTRSLDDYQWLSSANVLDRNKQDGGAPSSNNNKTVCLEHIVPM